MTIVMPHCALGIDEILRELAARVVDTHRLTAVSPARCTKSFEEPALSALWKIQVKLPLLIKTLPSRLLGSSTLERIRRETRDCVVHLN